jgi:alkanesulfonate monooxygenase SsuD/methylene tetrahydromethanopterin reductase-like flavin-dependent oxidoreductase (luciferase family)
MPPIWILGSSGAGAMFAGSLGVGYSFARHFSPAPPEPAVHAYLQSFKPSDQFPEPHVILGISAICADTEARAEYLAGSTDLVWVRYQRGEFGLLPSPEEAAAYDWRRPGARDRPRRPLAALNRHACLGTQPDRSAGEINVGE